MMYQLPRNVNQINSIKVEKENNKVIFTMASDGSITQAAITEPTIELSRPENGDSVFITKTDSNGTAKVEIKDGSLLGSLLCTVDDNTGVPYVDVKKIEDDNVVSYQLDFHNLVGKGTPGEQGERGNGIESIEQIESSTLPGGRNVWQITDTEGNTYDFIVRNGSAADLEIALDEEAEQILDEVFTNA